MRRSDILRVPQRGVMEGYDGIARERSRAFVTNNVGCVRQSRWNCSLGV